MAQTSAYNVCEHRAEWRVESPCFQRRLENRWKAKGRPFGKSQTRGEDARVGHPADSHQISISPNCCISASRTASPKASAFPWSIAAVTPD